MSDYFDRIASRTLGMLPVVHRRREPIFATSVPAERDPFTADVFDDAKMVEKTERGPDRVGRVATASAPPLDKQNDDVPQPVSTPVVASELHERSSVAEPAIVSSVRGFESVTIATEIAKFAEAKDPVAPAIAPSSDKARVAIKVDRRSNVDDRQQGQDAARESVKLEAPDDRFENAPTSEAHVIAVESYRASDRESDVVAANESLPAIATKINETEPDRGRATASRMTTDDTRRDDRAPTARDQPTDDEALTINVSIGRIDIVRPTPPSPPSPVARPSSPRPSLDDYMRIREKVRGR